MKIAADNQGEVNTDLDAKPPADGPEVAPKKHSHLVNLDVLRVSPLDKDRKDGANTATVGDDADTGTDVKSVNSHRLGDEKIGGVSVHDVIKRVTGHDNDKNNDPAPDKTAN